jgi:ethanolamine utilization protein EutP (predicted NTPase)
VFSGHPQDEYKLNGEYTRREPYPNLQFNSKKLLDEATEYLKKTKYYHPL